MKVLAALALVQIVGILGIAIAQEPISERDAIFRPMNRFQFLLHNFLLVGNIIRTVDDTESGKIKCETNGGPKAHDTAIESGYIFINSTNFLNEAVQLEIADVPENSLDSAIKTVCQWGTDTNELGRTYINSLKPCWTPAERNSVDIINNISTSVLRYFCQNRGERISAFIAAGGMQCLYSNLTRMGITRCINASFMGNVSILESQSLSPLTPPVIVPKTESCLELDNFQRCTVAEVQKCGDPKPANEVNSVLNIVMELLGCLRLLKAQTSPDTNIN